MAIGDTTFQETEAAVESEAAESEAAVEQKAAESASAVQDKSAAPENETTVPHFVGKLMIAALLMAFAVAAVTVISRIRRKRANERRRAAREARLRAWKESQAAEEEMEDSKDRV